MLEANHKLIFVIVEPNLVPRIVQKLETEMYSNLLLSGTFRKFFIVPNHMQAHVIMSVVAEKYFQSEHLHSECIQFDLKHIQFEQYIQSRHLFFFSNLDIIIRQSNNTRLHHLSAPVIAQDLHEINSTRLHQ